MTPKCWNKWCKKTKIKHEKYKEKERPTETVVQNKLDRRKKPE